METKLRKPYTCKFQSDMKLSTLMQKTQQNRSLQLAKIVTVIDESQNAPPKQKSSPRFA